MEKALFIYNPMSGDRIIPTKLDQILEKFQEKNIMLMPYRLHSVKDKNLTTMFQKGEFDQVIISGGDGTVNSIVNKLLKNRVDVPIGIIPSGTCNDFARCLNLPSYLNDCLDIILAGNTVEVDVGLINNSRYFLSTCAGGLFVNVSFSTHNELKKNFGPFAYYLKALNEVTNIKSFNLRIETENEIVEEESLLFLILNGKHAAGFTNIIKEADFSDGLMDIVLIKSCSHIDLASLFFKVLSNDSLNDKHVSKLTAKSCVITSDNEVGVSVDGEKSQGLPLKVEFINKGLKVFAKG
ncbi:MAG: YegS/Rv2252/BmrU family lipid kinase [Bacillota bacterium]|nr:YegS/Rv2252/BmrU family lipid kinase [Bacillota bacterium]